MDSISSCCINFASFPPRSLEEGYANIRKVVSPAFAELAAALALNITLSVVFGPFILPDSALFLTAACKCCFGALAVAKVVQNCLPQSIKSHTVYFFALVEGFSRCVARLTLINTMAMPLTHLIHEAGHAGAALLCYLQAEPSITIKLYEGMTNYNISYGLTAFGKRLGEHESMLFVTAAGLAAPVLAAAGELSLSHLIENHYPLISEIISHHAASQYLNLFLYGYKSLNMNKMMLENDFIRLWTMGDIHPYIPMALICAVPLYELASRYRKPNANATPTKM